VALLRHVSQTTICMSTLLLELPSFRDAQCFELWLTRILVNACLDRLQVKRRRARWLVSIGAWDIL